ncbi:hypothetical protein G6F35_012075 [Rhizopus arrhizus]|nr:hypothetical protein G6F35_012075 [Rhizopus arrhizus]
MQITIAGINRQRRTVERLGVAVQVHIALVRAGDPRKAVRIHGVHQQQRHARLGGALEHRRIVHQCGLAACAAEPFHAMRGGRHDQQAFGTRGADQRRVGCQRLAFAAHRLDRVRLHVGAQARGVGQEPLARFGVAAGEVARTAGHHASCLSISWPVRSWIQNSTTVDSVTVTIKYQAGAIGLPVTCSSQVTKNCAKPPNTEMPSPYTTDIPVVRTAFGNSSGSMVIVGAVCSASRMASSAITVIRRAVLGADTSH